MARSHTADAQLHDGVERVAEAWRGVGATVSVGATRFLHDDETIVIAMPDLPEATCTTVLLLGARGLGFHATLGPPHAGDGAGRIPSEAGALSIEQCGGVVPRRLFVSSDSGRGALEWVVARSEAPLARLHDVLPERSEGRTAALAEPGPLPAVPSPEKRADVVEARAKRDGAVIGPRSTLTAGVDGAGSGDQWLDPGCHILSLFAVDPRTSHPLRRGKLDLDAELRDRSDERVLARDRSDAPDARLPLCVAEPTWVHILFVGSPPEIPILVSHCIFALPEHLPGIWGSETKARMARVLLTRHVGPLPRDPFVLAQGGSGETAVVFPLEPGACYVAIAALAQGAARSVGLRVEVGAREAADDRGIDEAGASVAFCAGERSLASAQVEARGAPSLGWGLAVYRLQNGIWEVPW